MIEESNIKNDDKEKIIELADFIRFKKFLKDREIFFIENLYGFNGVKIKTIEELSNILGVSKSYLIREERRIEKIIKQLKEKSRYFTM